MPPMPEVVLIAGCPAAGKTSLVQERFPGYHRINRDTIGGSLNNLDSYLDLALNEGKDRIVLDNTYKTVASRRSVLDVAKAHKAKIIGLFLNTNTDQAMINVCMRMLSAYGEILDPKDIKEQSSKDPGIFPPAAIFGYHSKKPGLGFEMMTTDEGFDEVMKVEFKRTWPTDWTNKGVIVDFDDTIRYVLPECPTKYPTKKSHIGILPRRQEVIKKWLSNGYKFYGASNQSGVSKGEGFTYQDAQDCFSHTCLLLGIPISVNFCPHPAGAAVCYCRKPAPGLLLSHMWKRKLDPAQTIFVGDQTSDKTAAARLGLQYYHESEFFKA